MDNVKVERKIDVIVNEKDNIAAKMRTNINMNKLIIVISTTMVFKM